MGERMIAKREAMPLIVDEKANDFKVWQEVTDEGPKTVLEYTAVGVTP